MKDEEMIGAPFEKTPDDLAKVLYSHLDCIQLHLKAGKFKEAFEDIDAAMWLLKKCPGVKDLDISEFVHRKVYKLDQLAPYEGF